jgi:hypothetical protein
VNLSPFLKVKYHQTEPVVLRFEKIYKIVTCTCSSPDIEGFFSSLQEANKKTVKSKNPSRLRVDIVGFQLTKIKNPAF